MTQGAPIGREKLAGIVIAIVGRGIPNALAVDYGIEIMETVDVYVAQEVRKAKDSFHNHYSGKPEKHDIPCEDCGETYWVDYLLPHPVFNAVCPNGEGYLCLSCFAYRLAVITPGAAPQDKGEAE